MYINTLRSHTYNYSTTYEPTRAYLPRDVRLDVRSASALMGHGGESLLTLAVYSC